MRLSDFAVLSFDCYGTLIDWETGLLTALQPLLRSAPAELAADDVLENFARHEAALQAEAPQMAYSELLAEVHRRLAGGWNVHMSKDDHARFASSVADWPAFPDTTEALRYLQRHYKLIVLSNVDRTSFAGSQRRLGVVFDAVLTAQDIGSYKPDIRNFEHLLQHAASMNVAKARILHVAQSLYHDHVPANAIGLASAWIDRRHGKKESGATLRPACEPRYDFYFRSLAELARMHSGA